jgi:hypothetical protein
MFRAEQLGIGQTIEDGMRSKNYGRGNNRASKRSNPTSSTPATAASPLPHSSRSKARLGWMRMLHAGKPKPLMAQADHDHTGSIPSVD